MSTPAVPDVTLTIRSNGLGLAEPNVDGVQAVLGVSSQGAAEVAAAIGTIPVLTADYGTGPLVEAAAEVLTRAGGPIVVCPVASDVPGVNSAIAPGSSNTSTSSMFISGTPLDSYNLVVEVYAGGNSSSTPAWNGASFQYSLDGGITWSGVTSVPANGQYAIPSTGLTISFQNGALVAGDTFSCLTLGPGFSLTNLEATLTALQNQAEGSFAFLHIVGMPAPAWADGLTHSSSGNAYSPTHAGSTNPPAVTVYGTPVDYAQYQVKIVSSGPSRGVAQFGAVTATGTAPPTVTVDSTAASYNANAFTLQVEVYAAGTAGGNPAVTHTGTGTAAVTVDGTSAPMQAYNAPGIVVTVKSDVTKMDVAVNGTTVASGVAIPAAGTPYQVPTTMVVLDFGSGTYVSGDMYTIAVGTPAMIEYTTDGGHTVSTPLAVPQNGKVTLGNTGIVLDFTTGSAAYSTNDSYSIPVSAPAAYSVTKTGPSGSVTTLVSSGSVVAGANSVPGTGISINFASGTYTANDTWTWDTYTYPQTTAIAIAQAIDGVMSGWETAHSYVFAILDLPPAPDSVIKSAWQNVALTSNRIAIAAGQEQLSSVITGDVIWRPLSWSLASRVGAIPPGEEPGRVKSGAIAGIYTAGSNSSAPVGMTRDERLTPGLDAMGFTTDRSFVKTAGVTGYFFTHGRMFVPLNNDFTLIPARRCMDIACSTAYAQLVQELNDDVNVNTSTGYIDPHAATTIENAVTQAIQNALGTNVSGVSFVLSRTDKLLTSPTLNATVSITPKAYIGQISVVMQFVNPLLSQ